MPIDGSKTRRSIVEAAIELAADGLGAVTIDALTERSGATNGSIYHHFGSRDGVLSAALDMAFSQAMDACLPALDLADPEAAILDFVHRYLGWVADHRDAATVLYGVPLGIEAAEMSAAKQAAFAPLAAWLVDRMAAGEIGPMDLSLADPIAFGPVHEMCRRWLAHPDVFDLLETSDQLGGAVAAILFSAR